MRAFGIRSLAVATAVLVGSGSNALAQGAMDVGDATLKVGAGVARIILPDNEFLELQNAAGTTIRDLETNDADDDYGFSIDGELSIPTQGRSSWSDAFVVRGFYANIDSDDNRTCLSDGNNRCGIKPLVNAAGVAAVQAAPGVTLNTNTDREIDHWGAAFEARRYLGGQTGYKDGPGSKPGYFALGADIRGIQQETSLAGVFGANLATFSLNEELDTHYYGIFAAYGRDYKLPFFGNAQSGLGLQSSFRVWGGIYYADAEYDGRYSDSINNVTQNLSLSEENVAFIGGITLETRKKLGPRATLSLKSDYEYYSWTPEISYNDGAGGVAAGPNGVTRIDDDDAFSTRTTLNLKIKLGPRDVVQPYK